MKILDLCKKYRIDLKDQGDTKVGLCPFHNDTNRPNFTVYAHTDSWFCYTCSDGGDAIKFYAKIEGITRPEAIRKMFSGYQDIIDRINYVPEPKPYNELIDLQISKQFREFIYKYPDKLSEAMCIMQEVDELLLTEVDQHTAVNLVTRVNRRLNELKTVK